MKNVTTEKQEALFLEEYGIVLEEKASELTKGPGGLFSETNMYESQP